MLLVTMLRSIPWRLRWCAIHAWMLVCQAATLVFYRSYYLCMDTWARQRGPLLTPSNLRLYARGAVWHPTYATVLRAKQFAMLHPEILLLLRYCALRARGGVLEIGAYVGGSTVIIAQGVKEGGGTFISVEREGKHNHPLMPSEDIFRDLENNVRRFGVSDAVELLHGSSDDSDIRHAIEDGLRPCGINLCVLDADGRIFRDIESFGPLMNEGCVLFLDDYGKPGAARIPKMSRTMPWIDQEVAAARLDQLGVFGYGTWVGLYRKSAYAAIPFPAPPTETTVARKPAEGSAA